MLDFPPDLVVKSRYARVVLIPTSLVSGECHVLCFRISIFISVSRDCSFTMLALYWGFALLVLTDSQEGLLTVGTEENSELGTGCE